MFKSLSLLILILTTSAVTYADCNPQKDFKDFNNFENREQVIERIKMAYEKCNNEFDEIYYRFNNGFQAPFIELTNDVVGEKFLSIENNYYKIGQLILFVNQPEQLESFVNDSMSAQQSEKLDQYTDNALSDQFREILVERYGIGLDLKKLK